MDLKEFPNTVELVKVDPEKIEFIDMSLRQMGYSPRQELNIKIPWACPIPVLDALVNSGI